MQNNAVIRKLAKLSGYEKKRCEKSHTALYALAGVLGFEPRDNGVRVRCLTAWRYPSENHKTYYSRCITEMQLFL